MPSARSGRGRVRAAGPQQRLLPLASSGNSKSSSSSSSSSMAGQARLPLCASAARQGSRRPQPLQLLPARQGRVGLLQERGLVLLLHRRLPRLLPLAPLHPVLAKQRSRQRRPAALRLCRRIPSCRGLQQGWTGPAQLPCR